MAKRVTKAAIKRAAYYDAMKVQPTKSKTSKARWIQHSWVEKAGRLPTQGQPGFFPRASQHWHREGSIDEIERRENAGQREMF
ncbi:hypothetical protein [Sinorhizobium medicae]|uniref:hypothetical protein n=1 Tax=Sinorhizobium medicae TaxID=110321 RepID=UPI000FD90EA2|nr:hypothetical protein [Sinorhizobium medicae]RVP48124.1 hypothetical protein CN078_25615 [Sinorhizobium medicae]RVP75411.1 hypothetical protein CN079_19935 [Sinorhizobium medicae]UWU06615.1 hypothetical protein N2598_09475 [Sinorhizobium medicae]